MTILITGGAGYIGSQLTYRLADLGFETVVLDDLSTGFREAVPASVPLIVGSIEDVDLVRQLLRNHRVNAVMHLAASSGIEESMHDPGKYLRNNLSGTIALLQACIYEDVRRFILSSSASVYGSVAAGAVREDAPKVPVNPYGYSKLMAETATASLAEFTKLDFVVLRYFNVAGADPDLRTGHRGQNATALIQVASEVATGRRPYLSIYGSDYPTSDGTCIRDYIHVRDIADLHVAALEHLMHGGQSAVLNCGYGHGFSVLDIVRAFNRILGTELPTRLQTRRSGDPSVIFADATSARKLLGWTAQFDSIDTIIRSAVEWERRRYQL